MDTLELPIARALGRATRWLAAGTLCLGAGACTALEPSEDQGGDVDHIAERLVQTARERADLRQIRVWVAEIHETRRETTVPTANGTQNDLIGLRLEHELVIALATRLNVVESEMLDSEVASPAKAALGQTASARGATHVLVGDYVRQRDAIQITLRLVDADSRLIVAAARGSVKLAEIGLMGFDRWAANASERATLPIPGTVPRQTASQLSPQPTTATLAPPSNPGTAPRRTVTQLSPQHPTVSAATASKTTGTLKPPGPKAAPASALTPIPADSEPVPAKAAIVPNSTSRAWPVEDFETWRQRRMAEQQSSASQTVAALDEAARASTDPAVRARRNELASKPEEDAQQFPWRKNPWLARLLGVPPTTTTPAHR